MHIFLGLMFMSPLIWGSSLVLEHFDQQKLGDLIGQLPLNVRERSVVHISSPQEGVQVISTFPKNTGPFQFKCKNFYYNQSEYASNAECEVMVDPYHPDVEKNYDEVRIILKDKFLVRALFETIAFGRPEKKYYSYGRDPGTTFEGQFTNIFHFRFVCGQNQCEMRFSGLRLKD